MNIVILSPHPDDETLGAGGTLLRMKKEGNQVYWLNITDVVSGDNWSDKFVERRIEQIECINKKYQFDGFCNLKYIPCSLENVDKGELISKISEYFMQIKPEWVILPNPGDAHTDHRVVYEAAMSCTKVFRYPYVKKITTMEIISETDFNKNGDAFSPNYFVDITDFIDDKLETMKIYDTELGEAPFPRNLEAIKSLALVRGGTAGVKYAEAFKIVKWID